MKPFRSLSILGAAAALLLTAAWKVTGDVEPFSEPLTFSTTPVRNDLTLQLVATAPAPVTYLTHAGDDRLFVTLRDGRIVVLSNGVFRSEPFLDIRELVGQAGEGGLLSVAFHPRYAQNGFFFVNYTDTTVSNTVIARYRVSADPNRADPASRRVLLTIPQPFVNHNGGQLQFGPDGFLYIGMGDGGSANDPQCLAQREDTLLGKMLRIDVDQSVDTAPFYGIPADNPFRGPGGMRDEVWASGLRNPWRFSFDRGTGDLWTADVGQGDIEEIDRQPAGQGGLNYGWKVMEGSRCLSAAACPASTPPCNSPAYTLPVLEYEHVNGRCSVTGGYVYRGPGLAQLRGDYVFGDLCSGEIWTATATGGAGGSLAVRRISETLPQLATFGEDRNGELYVVRLTGQIYRIVGRGTQPPPSRTDTVGLFDPDPSRFLLKNRNVSGPVDRTVRFGRPRSRWVPLAGDWNGDGITTIGFYDPATGVFRLKNSLTGGNADITLSLTSEVPRAAETIPVVGDWDGNGQDSLGFYDRGTHTFRLKNTIAGPEVPFHLDTGINMGTLPPSGRYLPVMGDWDGDGDDTPGLFHPDTGRFVYVNEFEPGTFAVNVQYNNAGRAWLPVAGDWNGDGRDGLGLYDPGRGVFRLDDNLDGAQDVLVRIPNGRNKLPLAGAW